MKLGFVFAISCVFGLAAQAVLAQSGTDAAVFRALLLRPAGWLFEAKPAGIPNTPAVLYNDFSSGDLLFVAKGDAIVVQVRNITHDVACEREAKLEVDTVAFGGCFDPGVVMHFDPADPAWPYKARTPRGYDWQMKPK